MSFVKYHHSAHANHGKFGNYRPEASMRDQGYTVQVESSDFRQTSGALYRMAVR